VIEGRIGGLKPLVKILGGAKCREEMSDEDREICARGCARRESIVCLFGP